MKNQKALIYAKLSNFTLCFLFFLEKPLDKNILAKLQATFFPYLSHCGETEKKKKSWRVSLKEKNI